MPTRQSITKEEFNKKYDNHIKWLKNAKDGERLDLTNIDLVDSNIEVRGLNFSRSKCINTYFPSNLNHLDLTGSDLINADFSDSEVSSTLFEGCNLTNATFETADFSEAGIKTFLRCNLTNTNFENVVFRGRFTNCILDNTIFSESDLKSSEFINCMFDSTEFASSLISKCVFNGNTFKNVKYNDILIDSIEENAVTGIENLKNDIARFKKLESLAVSPNVIGSAGVPPNTPIYHDLAKDQQEYIKQLNENCIKQFTESQLILQNNITEILNKNKSELFEELNNKVMTIKNEKLKLDQDKKLEEKEKNSMDNTTEIIAEVEKSKSLFSMKPSTKEFLTNSITNGIKTAIGNKASDLIKSNLKKALIKAKIPAKVLNNPAIDAMITICAPQLLVAIAPHVPKLGKSKTFQIALDLACVSSIAKVSDDGITYALEVMKPMIIPMLKELNSSEMKKGLKELAKQAV